VFFHKPRKIPLYCDSRLDKAIAELDHAWDHTINRIRLNENTGFCLDEKGNTWNLLYDGSEKLDDSFFETLTKVEIADLLMFVGDIIEMWNGFTHIKGKYIKRNQLFPWQ
jgi:hypothetical protein